MPLSFVLRYVALLCALGACLGAGLACRPTTTRTTIRIIDGKPLASRYVSPGAYEHFLRAQISLNRGEFHQAARQIRVAIAHDHKSPLLHTELARILIQTGDHREADQQLRIALSHRPGFPDALFLRGKLALKANHRKGAEATLQHCIKLNPSYAPCHLALAELLEQSHRPNAARQILQRLISLNKDATEGHQRLALLCLRQLDYACATHHYNQVLTSGTDLRILLQLAHIHRSLGRMSSAIRLLRETFDRSGGDTRVASVLLQVLHHQEMTQAVDDLLGILETSAREEPLKLQEVAHLCLEVDRPARALALMDRATADTPPDAAAKFTLLRSEILYKMGRVEEALQLLRTQAKGEHGIQSSRQLAIMLGRQKAHQEASEVLRQAIKIFGAEPELILTLSRSLHLEGKIEASISVVSKALAKQPQSRSLQFGLAEALHRAKRWRQAIEIMKQIIAKDPDYAPGHNFIGYTQVELKSDFEAAERSIRRALFLQPGEGYIIDSLGWLYFRRGNMAKAKELLEMAARLEPDEAEILAHLAEIRIMLKQRAQAIRLLRRAIHVSEDQALVPQLQSRLQELEQGRVGTR